MARKISGIAVRQGHTALTRGLLRDSKVNVVSAGSDFYNANDFPILPFMFKFCERVRRGKKETGQRPDSFSTWDIKQVWLSARSELRGDNKIVIASTPDEVSQEYIRTLDGGILHESFHSLYTHKGRNLDYQRLAKFIGNHYDPEVPYEKKAKLLKTLWNIFEDSMIERRGMERFEGAIYSIQMVHQLVWDRETPGRRGPVGGTFYDENNRRCKAFTMLDHVVYYLRDQVENYLDDAPLDEYDPQARMIVDVLLGDLVEEGRQSKDTYECFELAFQALNRLSKLKGAANGKGDGDGDPQEQEKQGDEQQEGGGGGNGEKSQQDDEQSGDGESQSGDGQSDSEEGEGEDDGESEGGDSEGGDSEGESGDDGSDADGDSGNSSEDGSEGQSGDSSDQGGQQGTSGNENHSKAGQDSRDGEKGGGEGGHQEGHRDGDALPPDFDRLADEIANTDEANGGQDLSDVIKDQWEEETQASGVPSHPIPMTREYDIIHEVTQSKGNLKKFRKFAGDVRRDTLYIRPKMVAFLRGMKKSRRKHRLEQGQRLSGRSIHEIVYKKKPKPFMKRIKAEKEHAAVSIVIDESGSMNLDEARYILTTFAVSLQQLRIPFEVIGFQQGTIQGCDNAHNVQQRYFRERGISGDAYEKSKRTEEWKARFTRIAARRFNVFRTFDEPLTDKSLSKLMNTRANGGTPLADGMDFAARRLAQRKESRKVLIVITDGKPSGSSGTRFGTNAMVQICNNETKLLASMGIQTLFVGYGERSINKFDNSVYIPNLDSFGTVMNEHLFKMLRENRF